MTYIDPNDEWRIFSDWDETHASDLPRIEPARRDLSSVHDGTTPAHVIIKPSEPHGCHREYNCPICDGGLAICKYCGKAEAELDEPCTVMAKVHDSATCHADRGQPCEMCVAADEQERRMLLWADAATIRAAVLDVIDNGCTCGIAGGERHAPWVLDDEDDEDFANEQRCRFADALITRLAQLQQPPHRAPNLANLCDRHKRSRMPRPTTAECVDCRREREEATDG